MGEFKVSCNFHISQEKTSHEINQFWEQWSHKTLSKD